MKPKKLQFDERQIESMKTTPGSDYKWSTDQLLKAGTNARFQVMGSRGEQAKKIAEEMDRKVDENSAENRTFRNANATVASMEAKQKSKGDSLDLGVSGDAIARAKAGDRAQYQND
jgi:16S rRNA C1402 N4-methylase RsmH